MLAHPHARRGVKAAPEPFVEVWAVCFDGGIDLPAYSVKKSVRNQAVVFQLIGIRPDRNLAAPFLLVSVKRVATRG